MGFSHAIRPMLAEGIQHGVGIKGVLSGIKQILRINAGLILQIMCQGTQQLLLHLAIGIHLHALLIEEITHRLIEPVGKLGHHRQFGFSSLLSRRCGQKILHERTDIQGGKAIHGRIVGTKSKSPSLNQA